MNDVVLKLNLVETSTEWILMCESPSGGVTTRVPLPFTQDELSSALHEVETSIIRSYSKVLTRRTASPEKTALQFGGRLAEVLLSDDTRVLFEECRRMARAQGGRMRVLLETDGATVSQIPWEFAVDPRVKDDYLALRISFARHLRVSAPVPALAVKPPLRVLGVHAHPSDRPELDAAAEQESVAALGSVSSDLVQVTWLKGDRWSDLSDALSQGGWHILHFIGHGGYDEELGSGFLELSDDQGAALRVGAARIGAVAAQTGDLRLVVLNACESATSGAGAFSSTAAKLMREGIPAVVAMQYEITDPAALAFAAGFYETLARGTAVDQAVTKGREIVRITQNSLEWATPVLFLASDEAQLFDVQASKTEDGAWDTTLIEKLPKAAPAPTPPAVAPTPAPEPVRRSAPATPPPKRAEHHLPAIEQLSATEPLAPCRQIVLGPGDLVAMACTDGSVRAWSLRRSDWASRCLLPRGIQPTALSWSPWPRHVASAQDDGTVVVWDLEKEVPLHVLRPSVTGVAVWRSPVVAPGWRWSARTVRFTCSTRRARCGDGCRSPPPTRCPRRGGWARSRWARACSRRATSTWSWHPTTVRSSRWTSRARSWRRGRTSRRSGRSPSAAIGSSPGAPTGGSGSGTGAAAWWASRRRWASITWRSRRTARRWSPRRRSWCSGTGPPTAFRSAAPASQAARWASGSGPRSS